MGFEGIIRSFEGAQYWEIIYGVRRIVIKCQTLLGEVYHLIEEPKEEETNHDK